MSIHASLLSRATFRFRRGLSIWLILLGIHWVPAKAVAAEPTEVTVTNLLQMVQVMSTTARVHCQLRLEVTVCAASSPGVGVVIAQDNTTTELLELGSLTRPLVPGERIRIEQPDCLLRSREIGVQISAAPVVDNDGSHVMSESQGDIFLTAGWHPMRVEWFNELEKYGLTVSYSGPGLPQQKIPDSSLFHGNGNAIEMTNGSSLLPGLDVSCYEGNWNHLPDFNLLRPVKTGVLSNLDLNFRTQDEFVGLQFSGFLNISNAGKYHFVVGSDDGALLFIGDPGAQISPLGTTTAPMASQKNIGEPVGSLDERRWMTVGGRVSFLTKAGRGLTFQLEAGSDSMRVNVADAAGLDSSILLNSRVRVSGVGRGLLTADGRLVLSQLSVATGHEVVAQELAGGPPNLPVTLTSAEQVQRLPPKEAANGLPVRIRGIITSIMPRFDDGLTIQDDTRGIYVNLGAIPFWINPIPGECWEVVGHTGPGDFAPIILAEQINRLGDGQLPQAVRPPWNVLINGSLDSQWVEFQGLVTEVQSNSLKMLLPEGNLNVRMEGYFEHQLKAFDKAVVHIRGVLFAAWIPGTREVRVGDLLIRNGSINVDRPAPADPGNGDLKTIHDLLLFDVQGTTFQRIKVVGQIVHASPACLFIQEGNLGMQVLPAKLLESNLQEGDLIEAVGYPMISGPSPTLHEAFIRRVGTAPLPPPKILSRDGLKDAGLNSTLVRVEGRFLGWHRERGAVALEMQTGEQTYLATLDPGQTLEPYPRPGSRLALTGVYAGEGSSMNPGSEVESFELLLNSTADVVVLSQPSWWTLPRLLGLVGILVAILAFAAIWITQLRSQVEQRTVQLRLEIQERERAERLRAVEAERSRIARDLHDDLGSSLTEIAALARTGQLPQESEAGFQTLFTTITHKARDLIAALDVIVWAVDPASNSLQSLADYFSFYAEEYLSSFNIICRFHIPVAFPAVTLGGRVRHDLFLAIKEVLHNIVRHADANQVQFSVALIGDDLEITISDNGSGFGGPSLAGGHGLKNLSSRLEHLGGSCRIESSSGSGTTVLIRLPLSAGAKALAGPAQND